MTERENVLKKAKTSDLLNAVFLIAHYNNRCRSRRENNIIDIQSEFNHINKDELKAALESTSKMLLYSPYVGGAYYKYPNAMDFEVAVEKLKRENPGYTEECYDLAIKKSISDMR